MQKPGPPTSKLACINTACQEQRVVSYTASGNYTARNSMPRSQVRSFREEKAILPGLLVDPSFFFKLEIYPSEKFIIHWFILPPLDWGSCSFTVFVVQMTAFFLYGGNTRKQNHAIPLMQISLILYSIYEASMEHQSRQSHSEHMKIWLLAITTQWRSIKGSMQVNTSCWDEGITTTQGCSLHAMFTDRLPQTCWLSTVRNQMLV